MTTIDPRRVRRAIKRDTALARAAIHEARFDGGTFAARVALETVARVRKNNADRRRALRLGRRVAS
jgi:hypothetical protein